MGMEIALVLGGRWPMSCVNPSVLDNSGLLEVADKTLERSHEYSQIAMPRLEAYARTERAQEADEGVNS